MSDKSGDSAGEKKLDSTQQEAQRILEDLKQFRTQAEEYAKGAEAARQKADSEALYASNAKGACEGHSTAIAQLKGTVEADVSSISANKQKVEEHVAFVTSAKGTIDNELKTISDRRKEVDQASTEITEAARKGALRLEEIDESKTAGELAQKEIKEMLGAAIQARNQTEESQKRVEQLGASAAETAGKLTELHGASEGLSSELNQLLESAKAERTNLTTILEHLTKSDGVATGHEQRVEKLSKELEALIQKVENLLPGATSAGLASAFNTQKKRFGSPQRWWLVAFVFCMAGLVAVSFPSFINAVSGKTASTWGEILRGFSMRLPIVIPLVWLAIYAGRNYMLSQRLEEDYAYKEAISTAFEGYKREMEKIVSGDAGTTPITTLCVNVLRAIAERPGRIYDGKHQDITLVNEGYSAVQKAAELSQNQLASR